MGWFNGPSRSSSVRRRTSSPTRKSKYSTKSSVYSSNHYRNSAPSIFNLGRGGGRASPTRSVFSSFSSSSRRARPREGFVQRLIHSIKKLFRQIWRYARQHPMKVFLLVIVPLLTSGVLPKLLAMVGLRLPHGVSSALGASAGARRMGEFEHGGMSDNVNSLMSLAKMFL
ncbi:hypothetical protein N7495_006079 [Penicillium taxi]|uniref:uncharacterized protein n=1 Tax=Penicillium taxi TaxID=168475 RepID=UPI0025451429|nr:uncharacterized protein N7495_006079 [Penicillium taxi]KAJ5894388.1 hypothetical protein N7495_006079 [Penicillium taxi]